MLLQVLLGGIAGLAVSIKMFGKRIFRIFTFWKKDDEGESASNDAAASNTGEHEAASASGSTRE